MFYVYTGLLYTDPTKLEVYMFYALWGKNAEWLSQNLLQANLVA